MTCKASEGQDSAFATAYVIWDLTSRESGGAGYAMGII